jgi:hypothetical protein
MGSPDLTYNFGDPEITVYVKVTANKSWRSRLAAGTTKFRIIPGLDWAKALSSHRKTEGNLSY